MCATSFFFFYFVSIGPMLILIFFIRTANGDRCNIIRKYLVARNTVFFFVVGISEA